MLEEGGFILPELRSHNQDKSLLTFPFPPYHLCNPHKKQFYPEETHKRKKLKSVSMTEMENERDPAC